jgi:CheY-like chemotaxis protein
MNARRILVVDDNVQAAETLAIILRHWGHDVRVTFDGAAGLAAVAEYRPDVVILDIEMPTMSGVEVARQLRGLPDHDAVTLISLTGHDVLSLLGPRSPKLFDHTLSKPLNMNALERLLARLATTPQAASA